MNSISSLRLCDIATAEVLTISPDTSIRETIRHFAESHVSCIVVIEHDSPVGIVTERDLLRMMCTGFDEQRPVRAIMSVPLVTVREDMDFTAAQLMMSNRTIRHLVLVDDKGRLCGVASETDFRRSLGQDLFGAIENLNAVMDHGIEFVHPDQTLSEGLNVMASKRLDHIIVGDHRQAQGILTERDIPRLLAQHVDPTTVTMRDVMSAPVATIGMDVSVYEAAKQMEQRRVRHMVVVDANDLLAGVVSQHRILDRLAAVLLEDSRHQMGDQLISMQENSEVRLHYLIENMPVPLCRVNAQGELVYINRQFQKVFGYTLTDVPTLDQWWIRAYPDPAYRAWVLRAWEEALEQAPLAGGIVPAHEYMVTCHDGTRRTVEISGITLGEECLVTFKDVTEHRLQQSLLAFSNGILQQVSTGAPLLDVLDHMTRVFEKQVTGVKCSILLLTEGGQQLVHAAGPSLPQAYCKAIDMLDIGPLVGSCGTAAHTCTDVFAADIATDPHWVNYKTVALEHGLAACWSSPILSTTQAVLGTFALYWPTPQTGIDAVARNYVTTATALAAIAIEGAQRQADLQANHAQLLRAEAYALLGSWSVDTQFQRPHWSAQMFRLFHMEPRPVPPCPDELLERIHPDDQYLLKAADARMQEGLLPAPHLMRTHPAFGPVRWIRPHSYPVMDEQGRVVGFEGTMQDVTEQVQAQERLQLAAGVFMHAREAIAITDVDGHFVNVNDMFCHLTGYSADEVIGRNPRILKSGKQTPEFYEAMWRSLLNKGLWDGELWNRRKNGELFLITSTISAVRSSAGKTTHYVSLFSDITEQQAQQQQLDHMAHFDVLTGLPNRLLLEDRLQQAMLRCLQRNTSLAVVMLDLDGFKLINDAHGHEAGDEMLGLLAHGMRQVLRPSDTLARLGGDEFVAVLVDLESPCDFEPLLGTLLEATARSVTLCAKGGETVKVGISASAGVTIYPQDRADADVLMRHADQAMYAAKQAGRNRFHVFDIAKDSAIQTQHETLNRIRLAIVRQEFVLFYQPKLNMRTQQVVGVEALIRWQHPDRGLLSPSAFLPVLEDHPLSIDLGEWVIETALAQMAHWQHQGLRLPVSVNIHARQLQQIGFAAQLSALLAKHPQVSAQLLQLEVLETSAVEDMGTVGVAIKACQGLGVTFALDDFGTGYSSLTYLRRLPAETLKIDQSFVRGMLNDEGDLAIVSGVIGLAKAFGRTVIAEGVETEAHGHMLLSLGCDLAQGYGIARPMPAADVATWVQRWQANARWLA